MFHDNEFDKQKIINKSQTFLTYPVRSNKQVNVFDWDGLFVKPHMFYFFLNILENHYCPILGYNYALCFAMF